MKDKKSQDEIHQVMKMKTDKKSDNEYAYEREEDKIRKQNTFLNCFLTGDVRTPPTKKTRRTGLYLIKLDLTEINNF